MKKIKDFILKNYSKIMFVLLIVIVIAVLNGNNTILGAINPDTPEKDPGFLGKMMGFIFGFTKYGVIVNAIVSVITLIESIVVILLWIIFGATGLGFSGIPFPDDLIFNRVAFFDPNFINPTTVSNAPVHMMQSIIQNIYFSMFTVATAIFIIAAMVIGIKLAISSIAEEKAQYKKSLTNWIMGIVLLFSAHILMAGIFKLNETIVHTASKSIKDNVEFDLPVLAGVPVVGKTIDSILTSVKEGLSIDSDLSDVDNVKGYQGLIWTVFLRGLGGDLIYALAFGALIGQTIALIVAYAKRLFYCIFLGIMAPIIIALDTIKKSIA